MTATAHGDPKRFALGLGLVLLGLAWLLGTFHVLPVWRIASYAGAAALLGLAALCYLTYATDRVTRWGFLVPAGVFTSLSLIVVLEGTLPRLPDAFHALVFFAGPAVAFARIHALDRSRGWALMAAALSAVLGATAFLGDLGVLDGDLGGAIFLGGTGAIFFWHFLRTGKDWAILPAGFLFSSAVVVLLDNVPFIERLAPSMYVAGLALTFAAYHVLGRPGSSGWARVVAIVLTVVATLALVGELARSLLAFGAPLALIGLGIYLLLRGRSVPRNGEAPPAAPAS